MSTTPPPMRLIRDGLPESDHRDPEGNCWWGSPGRLHRGQWQAPCWFYGRDPDDSDTHWASFDSFAVPTLPDDEDEDDDRDHPSLSAAERNPGLSARMGVR